MTDWLVTLVPLATTMATAIALAIRNLDGMDRIRELMGRRKNSASPWDRKGPRL